MNKNVLHILCVTILGSSFMACSLKKDAETMRDATKNIEKNSKQLTDRTEDLTHDMREVETLHSRKEALGLMDNAQGDADRFAGAALFLLAMEYQKWKGDYSDSSGKREGFFTKAVTIFFAHVKDWINNGRPLNVNDDLLYFVNDAVSPSFRKAGAMSAELDIVHPEQKGRAEAAGVPTVSMYDLILNSLKMRDKAVKGETLPEYTKAVLEWERNAIYLLQLRHNFLVAKAMGCVTAYGDNYIQKILMGFSWTRWLVTNESDLDSVGALEYEKVLTLLKKAEDTKEDLAKLGVKPAYNEMIMKAWNSIEFTSKDSEKLKKFTDAQKKSLAGYLAQ